MPKLPSRFSFRLPKLFLPSLFKTENATMVPTFAAGDGRCIASTSPRCERVERSLVHLSKRKKFRMPFNTVETGSGGGRGGRCGMRALFEPFQTGMTAKGVNDFGIAAEFILPGKQGSELVLEDDRSGGDLWDVVGLGQAMVDFGAKVEESTLQDFGVACGGRRVVDVTERAEILQKLDGNYVVRAGSSLSNTLVALSRLSRADYGISGGRELRVGMAGCIGADVQGEFFKAQLRKADVEFLSIPEKDTLTGSVFVFTTPDAQRTFVAYSGSPEFDLDANLKHAIARSRVLVIEGYLAELPGSEDKIRKAVSIAKECGTLVGLTGGDAGLVTRHRDFFWELIQNGVDMLFTNQTEAAALLGGNPDQSAHDSALQLATDCPIVAVTDGCKGSYITALGRLQVVPPCWVKDAPVDTCGAGDVYAAGLLYGFLRGFDLYGMGQTAARSASSIITKHGARLSVEEAADVMTSLRKNPKIATPFVEFSTESQMTREA